MRASIVTVILVSLLVISFESFSQSKDCKLKKDSDGILIYACKAENDKFKSLKAEFTINNTTIDELMAFLKNVDNYPKWQYNMVTAKILEKKTAEMMITRSEIDAPWPVQNRELIVQYEIIPNAARNQLHIITNAVPTYPYPLSDDLVRVPASHAEWNVVQSGTNLKVTYIMNIDPGGSVPAWIINMAIAEGPHHTFVNLKKALE
jgi:hypothetical protein